MTTTNGKSRVTDMTTYTNPNPYQYLGCDVSDTDDIDEMLRRGGADFTMEARPVQLVNDAGDAVDIPSHRAITRTDTDEVFGIHSKNYTVVQYRDVLASARDALASAGADFKAQTCGVIDGGRQFYASFFVDRTSIDPEGVNDQLDTYLNLFSSGDGTLGITYAFDSFRMICSNQAPSLDRNKFRVSAKHTVNVQERIGVGLSALSMATQATQQFAQQAMALQAKPSSPAKVLQTIERLWGSTEEAEEGRGRTRAENRRDAILSIYKSDTCVGAVGNTRWAEFNAFTEYLDHNRLKGGEDPAGKMAKTSILPGTWVEKEKVKIGQLLLSA